MYKKKKLELDWAHDEKRRNCLLADSTDMELGRDEESWSAKNNTRTTVEKERKQLGWATRSNMRQVTIDRVSCHSYAASSWAMRPDWDR